MAALSHAAEALRAVIVGSTRDNISHIDGAELRVLCQQFLDLPAPPKGCSDVNSAPATEDPLGLQLGSTFTREQLVASQVSCIPTHWRSLSFRLPLS